LTYSEPIEEKQFMLARTRMAWTLAAVSAAAMYVVLVAAPASAAYDLDHFKCYKAKDLKMPKFAKTTIQLEDQFVVNDGTFEAKKPFLYCNPVDKNDEGINNSTDNLTCYKVKGPKLDKTQRPNVQVDNQFGTIKLQAKKPYLLCVPTTSTLIP
jgi:hypothetical protein